MLFLPGCDSGLVFSRRVRYRLVWPFSIPVDSPKDKRGIVWSGNCGLRFGIRADNGRLADIFGPRVIHCIFSELFHSLNLGMGKGSLSHKE